MKNAFVQLVLYGVGGAAVGILAGLALSFLIRGLLMLVVGTAALADSEFPQVVHMFGTGVG